MSLLEGAPTVHLIMRAYPDTMPPQDSFGVAYAERLSLPWWAWPAALGGSAVVVAELTLGMPGLTVPGTGLAMLLTAAGLGLVRRWPVQVSTGTGEPELRVDDAHLPVRFVRAATPLSPTEVRELLGPAHDPMAFVVLRPWVRTAVRVDLADPADPTPYWVISSRRPEQLAQALTDAAPHAGDPGTQGDQLSRA
jgi:DUF3093 family protein